MRSSHITCAVIMISRLCSLIVWVRVIPRRTVVGDIDRCFDNLSGSVMISDIGRPLSVRITKQSVAQFFAIQTCSSLNISN